VIYLLVSGANFSHRWRCRCSVRGLKGLGEWSVWELVRSHLLFSHLRRPTTPLEQLNKEFPCSVVMGSKIGHCTVAEHGGWV
jgi:hypothetical protein